MNIGSSLDAVATVDVLPARDGVNLLETSNVPFVNGRLVLAA